MAGTDYDCQACGACCVSEWEEETYVHLDRYDVARIPHPRRNLLVATTRRVLPLALIEEGGNDEIEEPALRTRYNRLGQCVCAALSGTPGEAVSCSIYEVRPKLCRQFRPGSEECLEARADMGLSNPRRRGA